MIGEQAGMMRSIFTGNLDHPAEYRLSACTHVQRLAGKPHSILADRLRTSRVQRAHSAAALLGQVMDIVIAPRRSSTCRLDTAQSDVVGGTGAGTIVSGRVMNLPVLRAALASPPQASLRQQ